jgi:hypothetical protein
MGERLPARLTTSAKRGLREGGSRFAEGSKAQRVNNRNNLTLSTRLYQKAAEGFQDSYGPIQ